MGIREEMPLLARHEGVWDGTYIYYNAAGEQIDAHSSRLFCRLTGEGEAASPGAAKNAMAHVLETPDNVLRVVGVASAAIGVILVWFMRG